MSADRSSFTSYQSFDQPKRIRAANHKYLKAIGVGNIKVETLHSVFFTKVLHVPKITKNLLSLHQLSEVGLTTTFHTNFADIHDSKTGRLIAKAHSDGSHYRLQVETPKPDGAKDPQAKTATGQEQSAPGHAEEQAESVLGRVSCGVCGPIQPTTREGHRYIATFTDEYSRYTRVGFVKNKGDFLKLFKNWKAHAEGETGRKLEIFRTDRGGICDSDEFREVLANADIKHELVEAVTLLDDNTAKQAGHILHSQTRRMVEDAKMVVKINDLPPKLWDFAIRHTIWTKNRALTDKSEGEMTPYEVYMGKKPTLEYIRPFGCKAIAHIPKRFQEKIGALIVKGIHIGSIEEESVWMLYDQEKRRIISARNVEFVEADNSGSAQEGSHDEESGRRIRGVGKGSKGVAERQNGDLEGDKSAKEGNNQESAPKIAKPTKTRPSSPQNPLNSTQKASTTQPTTTESNYRRSNCRNPSKSPANSDNGRKSKTSASSPSHHQEVPKPRPRACTKRPIAISLTQRRDNRQESGKSTGNSSDSPELMSSVGCDMDQLNMAKLRGRRRTTRPIATGSLPHRPNQSNRWKPKRSSKNRNGDASASSSPKCPRQCETATSVGEIDTDRSVGDTEGENESIFTSSMARDNNKIDSDTSESLQDSDKATRQRNASVWIWKTVGGGDSDEEGQSPRINGDECQEDGTSGGESTADKDNGARNANRWASWNRQNPTPIPNPHRCPPPNPSRPQRSMTEKSDLQRSIKTDNRTSSIWQDQDSGSESDWYPEQRHTMSKGLAEGNLPVGGKGAGDKVATYRSSSDDESWSATTGPRSLNRVGPNIAKHDNSDQGEESTEIDDPIDMQLHERQRPNRKSDQKVNLESADQSDNSPILHKGVVYGDSPANQHPFKTLFPFLLPLRHRPTRS
jgi:hypothetical protein